MRKRLAIALVLLLAVQARADEHKVWAAGPYSVSDELGGFTITSVTGTGLREDPIVVTQEFTSSSPVTLVIRAIKLGLTYDDPREFATGTLRIRLETLNNSDRPGPSSNSSCRSARVRRAFSDGLSFDQRRDDGQNISSDSFASFSREFRTLDRLRFTDGRIDPLKPVRSSSMITDFTPRPEFYLVQDPRIPLS